MCEYELVAVIIHVHGNREAGHYVSVAKQAQSVTVDDPLLAPWVWCDDHEVHVMPWNKMWKHKLGWSSPTPSGCVTHETMDAAVGPKLGTEASHVPTVEGAKKAAAPYLLVYRR